MTCFRFLGLAGILVALSAVAGHACADKYTVQKGDSLWTIAQHQTGSVFHFSTIHEMNLDVIGPDPARLHIGMELSMPCATADNDLDTRDWSVMPEPEMLWDAIVGTDVQVLDIRSAKSVKKGMLPRTVSMPYKMWRGPKGNPGEPPAAEQLATMIAEAGLRLDAPIAIVHQKPTAMDTGRAAYVYWLLKSVGAEQVSILRGGYKAWAASELPVALSAGFVDSYEPAPLEYQYTWRADEVDVFGIATKQISGHLLDARPHSVVNRLSKLGEAVATTLPGARNAPVQPLMQTLAGEVRAEDGVEAVVAHLKSHKANWREGPVVSFCSAGELAALNWFYASEIAGLENFKLYPESVKGWADQGGNLFVADQDV